MKGTTLHRVRLRSNPCRFFCYPRLAVPGGTEVTVLELAGEWLRVAYHDQEGYLRRDAVELEPGLDAEYQDLPEVLLGELSAIRKSRGEKGARKCLPPCGEGKDERLRQVVPAMREARLAALCLSGGGIRSATFNLGMLQGLARTGVLREIDYLSTVSGGGYIGSWLSSWISRESGTERERLDKVIAALAQKTPEARRQEPYQVRFLRDYSNYLTPRVGLFSIDTWSIIGTYLRNLLLNWLVLIPLLFTFLLLPRFLVFLTVTAGAGAGNWLLWAGGMFGIFPIAYTVVDLPSVGDGNLSKKKFVVFSLVPLVLMAGTLASYWSGSFTSGRAIPPDVWSFIAFATVVHLAGWVVGLLCLGLRSDLGKIRRSFWPVLVFFLCAALTGAAAGAIGWLAAEKMLPVVMARASHPQLVYALFAVPLLLADYLLAGTLLVALLSRLTGEQDREWWGRAGGAIMLVGLVWIVLLAVVIYGPWLILPESYGAWKKGYALVAGGAGVAAAWIGKSDSTPALRPGVSMDRLRTLVPAAAAGLFLLFLLQLMSLLATCLLLLMQLVSSHANALLTAVAHFEVTFPSHLDLLTAPPLPLLFLLVAAAALLWCPMVLLVNINTFSMHAMYRNRLVRCYLGASRERKKRCPNPFTGFDVGDDTAMEQLCRRPFHVVNMAWNLVKGDRLAWQQRKAASFTMSPLFAGSDLIIEDPKKGVQPGGYRSMEGYGAGRYQKTPLTLGTAMAISGAAASPNMGYHSSMLVTFVMAVFNVRLGWWLGNPGTGMGGAWREDSPRVALLPLLKETFGFTREEGRDIYLSDGGHFENLGLYEMVRRRCRYIIVCDAGCDSEGRFQDLGNAVRKVRADFGVEIDIDLAPLRARRLHFAVGEVRYCCCDGVQAEQGELLYLKPVLTGDESADLLNYGKMHAEFPHEPTTDQWFDEAQFESYRKLGLHSAEGMGEAGSSLAALFARATKMHRHALKEVESHNSTR